MRILLIDGNNLVAKTSYVWEKAKTTSGFPTGGLYGSVVLLRALLARESFDAAVCAIDWGIPAFRKILCPEYKAQRHDVKKSKEDEERYQRYKVQMPVLHEILCPLGIMTARAQNWEGDDVLAALALHRLKDHRVTIYSSDRDFAQLTNGRITVYDHSAKETASPWREEDRYFCLKRCLDPKGSDNLDGVPGVGPKKATRIVEEWVATLEEEPEPDQIVPLFVEWCELRKGDKVADAIVEKKKKVWANWKCTHLPRNAAECDKALKIRKFAPDAQAFREACLEYNLRPLLEDFAAIWAPFSRLTTDI